MALPWHYSAFSQFKDPAAVEAALKANAETPGMYAVPWADPNDEEAMKKAEKKSTTGLLMFASIRP
jgi:hypothetical protein